MNEDLAPVGVPLADLGDLEPSTSAATSNTSSIGTSISALAEPSIAIRRPSLSSARTGGEPVAPKGQRGKKSVTPRGNPRQG
jgi:hypothetical protein